MNQALIHTGGVRAGTFAFFSLAFPGTAFGNEPHSPPPRSVWSGANSATITYNTAIMSGSASASLMHGTSEYFSVGGKFAIGFAVGLHSSASTTYLLGEGELRPMAGSFHLNLGAGIARSENQTRNETKRSSWSPALTVESGNKWVLDSGITLGLTYLGAGLGGDGAYLQVFGLRAGYTW